MTAFRPCCLPTAVGSLPHTDPHLACDLVLRYLPEIPAWPQLPNRTPLENMYVQFFERFPGAVIDGDKVYVDSQGQFEMGLERLYTDYLDGATADYDLRPRWAAGLAEMRRRWTNLPQPPQAIKGQITGPVSAGLQITDRRRRPVLYDEVLADALAKYLRLVASEHERVLAEACRRTIVFVDEPYLSAVGSGFIQVRRELVSELLGEVLGGLRGLKGIHCCGNTDWSLVLETGLDVLSFDAYNYAETLALYPRELKGFLRRGGILAWGVVPSDQRALDGEDANSLVAKLLGWVELLAGKGLEREEILATSLITPSCGLGTLAPAAAARALALTAEVAGTVRSEFLDGVC